MDIKFDLSQISFNENKSPLRYPGGKSRACKIIEETINNCKPISKFKRLISPFFGGGSFEFYLQNKYYLDVIGNDKFEPLYNFWVNIKYNKKELSNVLRTLRPVTKEQFLNYRQLIANKDIDSLKRAAYYFVINRCSFSGATLSGGFSKESSEKRFTSNSINNILSLNLSKIVFENKDFIEFLDKYYQDDEETLIFLDPPYYLNNPKLYGDNGDLHEYFDHKALFEILKKRKNWVLCYNDCDYINKLYTDYEIYNVNWSYGMNKSKESSEIIIVNF